ncbi:polysaccharide deacetylase family protein [Halorubrum halophilum]|uniref:polysaccharide deacetylase family protein n=1 Tax=Halorubrum halophilum TaxID=413816 RepID=UPI000679D0C9|nr:polysaccharide deacetylase family protein [Halorubrum halophilum]
MTCYLTVDDAPSSTLDEKLDALAARDVPALLFCEGSRLDCHPEYATRAVREGVHLGNHTWSHPRASELSEAEFVREIERTERRIEAAYDRVGATRPAKLFRFPYGDTGGERAARFERTLRERGFAGPNRIVEVGTDGETLHHWPWTCSVEDWTTDSVTELRDRFEAAVGPFATDDPEIVLFHDAANSPALFEAFVGWLCDHDREPGDPVDLVT